MLARSFVCEWILETRMSRFGKATYYCCPASDEIAKKTRKEKRLDRK
jgi:hypothetical protein